MVTVTEGQVSVAIKFKATAPPSFYCSILDNKDSCHVKLSVTTVIERYGDFCVDSSSSQLVIGSTEKDGEKSCDITITNENWKEEFIVLVKAKIDNLFDGDKTRKVEFSGQMKSEFVDTMEHKFFTVKVTIIKFCQSNFCSKLLS